MSEEVEQTLTYNGTNISVLSDDKTDFVSLTNLAQAWKNRKSISTWLKNKQTLEYLNVWEKKHNPDYRDHQMGVALKMAREGTLSIKNWIEVSNAHGIYTRTGISQGTYAHKDIAIKFAGWLNPDLELWIVEKIQELRKLEEQKNSYELLDYSQILFLTRIKEVFKYVAHQTMVEEAHKDVFAAQNSSKNPFAEFHKWRNKILNIEPKTIDNRIKQYCIDNHIALTKKILSQPKNEKILMLDSYESVRNAVWDFLRLGGEVNALNLANLVGDMIRTEQGEVLRNNEENLFQQKQNLGSFNEIDKILAQLPHVKTAREVLAYRDKNKSQTKLIPDISDKQIAKSSSGNSTLDDAFSKALKKKP